MINTPVLHVNGDHPEGEKRYITFVISIYSVEVLVLLLDVVRAMDIAFRYRNYFRKV